MRQAVLLAVCAFLTGVAGTAAAAGGERVTRAEFVEAVVIAARLPLFPSSGDLRCFSDFRGREERSWAPACAAREAGLVAGYRNGSFGGRRPVIFAEALKIGMHAFQVPLPQYVREPDRWYDPYMDAAAGMGLFRFLPTQPRHPLTRGEADLLLSALAGDAGISPEPPPPEPFCDGYRIGESYPSPDGCNTCTCTVRGSACTLRACVPDRADRCFSSADCRSGWSCSTEHGDCRPACRPGSQVCIQVCAGVCER